MSKVLENVGCNNQECLEKNNCKRNLIAKNNTAVEVKSFGGTPQKGCGKFIPLDN